MLKHVFYVSRGVLVAHLDVFYVSRRLQGGAHFAGFKRPGESPLNLRPEASEALRLAEARVLRVLEALGGSFARVLRVLGFMGGSFVRIVRVREAPGGPACNQPKSAGGSPSSEPKT